MDDGKGFTPGEEEKVFQRFYSGDAGGSGIGLAITKAIVEGNGGELRRLMVSWEARCLHCAFRFNG
ncbi:sensor histidine kinase [Neobacillus sp. NPDC097160]|uniref:sensor histidine kinase n=1 Tax=Neobacillus sp. NPDC097160 TaxID=3364298 RepID=UPI0037F22601